MPYFSFVMVCYNNWDFTRTAVESFFESLNPLHKEKGIEFILVNNGSGDGTLEGVEVLKLRFHEDADIVTIHLEQNLGYTLGVNIGLSKCNSKIITILNNDLIFCPGWFDGLVDILENNQTIGVAAPFLTNGSGAENVELEFDSPEFRDAVFCSKYYKNYLAHGIMEQNREAVVYSSRVIGACVTIKREVLELIGGLDFWYGIGIFDDDDFTLRVNIAGYKTVIVGRSFVYHVGNATFSKERSVSNAAVLSNKMKFIRKWKIRCHENIEGLYNSRVDVILHTSYSREEHFVPISLDQYKSALEVPKDKEAIKRILLIADWTNFKSRWLEKLESILSQSFINKEIHLWMPDTYYTEKELKMLTSRIDELCKSKFGDVRPAIMFNRYHINPVDLLEYISSFDEVLSVEDDFVNRYITHLARQIGMSVIET